MAQTKYATGTKSTGVYGGEYSEWKPTNVEVADGIRIRDRYAEYGHELIGKPSRT